ncbi:MAG: hypothetical protein QOF69_1009 [Solirubrobacteraceae bacterium]|jgi:DNA polymerase III epsilon subunit-like protein|nr:hypothetical protein [Solirubrobacteraceae bacterium]
MPDDHRPDLYISADVETDGPVPGPYSLLAFGMAVAGTFDGDTVRRAAQPQTFYRELRPISDEFQDEALEVNGLDRNRLLIEGTEPPSAMDDAAAWVREVSTGYRPVLVAYPVAFDWSFLYWYFEMFAHSGSPFGHSSCLDIRTLYQAHAGTVFDMSSKRHMPPELVPQQPHTHNALDDALEQAELFINVLTWAMEGRIDRRPDALPARISSAPSWLARRVVPLA